MRKQRVYGGSRGYRSAREIVVCARMLVRGLPSGRHIGCKALRLKRRTDKGYGRTERSSYATDTCACTSGATGAASQGKHPTLGRAQQQHATAATS